MRILYFTQAFDVWYSLVVAQSGDAREMCLDITPNDEVPSKMTIWLDLVDLLQVHYHHQSLSCPLGIVI